MSDDGGPKDRPQLEDLVHRARTEVRDWTDTPESDPGVALLELFALVGDLLSSHSERLAAEAYLGSGHRHGSAGRRNEFEVEVDGQAWRQVTDLAGSGAEDRHYLVSRRDDGASVIEFGDGLHGQRPPSTSSIGVRYRHAGAYLSVLLQQGRVTIDTDESEHPPRPTCGVYRAVVLDNTDPLLQRRLLLRVPDIWGDEAVWAAACLPVSGAKGVPAVGDGVWIALESCDPSRPIWLGQRVAD
jgi:Type VI secretion system/phage-baseplate injector OB domain